VNRRRFLGGSSVAAASAALGVGLDALFSLARSADCAAAPPGVQLYTVRDALVRDLRGTLASLEKIGIVEAELYGFGDGDRVLGVPPAQLRRLFDAHGIRLPFAHVDDAPELTPTIADIAHGLGVSTVVVALPREFMRAGRMVAPATRMQLDNLAERLNGLARDYRARGLGFAYHNHWMEFVETDGVLPYEYLIAKTDPGRVGLELDVGWAAFAGVDAADLIRRHGRRILACHLKDFDPAIAADANERKLVPPGDGMVDFRAVFGAMSDAKVAHGFIEIDTADDPLAAVARGERHLQTLPACS